MSKSKKGEFFSEPCDLCTEIHSSKETSRSIFVSCWKCVDRKEKIRQELNKRHIS